MRISRTCAGMRPGAALLAFLCLSLMTGTIDSARATDDPATSRPDSTAFRPEEHLGSVVYLDFWASWCAPCKQSFPWMVKLHERFAEQGLEIIAVNLDRDEKRARAFLEQSPVPFSILYDPEGKMAGEYEIQAMPSSFLFGRDGTRRSMHLGFKESEVEELESEIASLLAEAVPDSMKEVEP